MGKRGPQPWIPSEAQITQIRDLAKQGLTLEQIAYSIGVSYVTLHDRAGKYPEIPQAIAMGRTEAIRRVSAIAYKLALAEKPEMVKFFLRTIGKWTETHEITGPAGAPIPFKQVNKGMTITEANSIAKILAEASRGRKK